MMRHLILTLMACAVCIPLYSADEAAPAPVVRLTAMEWCFNHDLPKDRCVACDKKLIPKLRKDGDFCAEHKTAESVCGECDAEAPARIEALRPDHKEWPAGWKPKPETK